MPDNRKDKDNNQTLSLERKNDNASKKSLGSRLSLGSSKKLSPLVLQKKATSSKTVTVEIKRKKTQIITDSDADSEIRKKTYEEEAKRKQLEKIENLKKASKLQGGNISVALEARRKLDEKAKHLIEKKEQELTAEKQNREQKVKLKSKESLGKTQSKVAKQIADKGLNLAEGGNQEENPEGDNALKPKVLQKNSQNSLEQKVNKNDKNSELQTRYHAKKTEQDKKLAEETPKNTKKFATIEEGAKKFQDLSAKQADLRKKIAELEKVQKNAKKYDIGSENKNTKKTNNVKRSSKKISISQVYSMEAGGERKRSISAMKRAQEKRRKQLETLTEVKDKISREVILPETISVTELANRMSEPVKNVLKELMKLGVMASVSQVIDAETAELVIDELGHKSKRVKDDDIEKLVMQEPAQEVDLKPRPPVVTIMGHVDHGKTSLLDAIRKANVVSGEAGGITQHIGAYQIRTDSGEKITFLDTPGHEAFTSMRSRGAKVTDIVVLVVAADDSVMPQTIEAINHAKAAGVPIIVAINKIDKPQANPQKVKNALIGHEVIPEDMGGENMFIEVSALQNIGLKELLDAISLQAEMLELKATDLGSASGYVIESSIDATKGVVATFLIERGVLETGQTIIAGAHYGNVRLMQNDTGKNIKKAKPAMPVKILGLGGSPNAGDKFIVAPSDKIAREIAEYRARKLQEKLSASRAVSFENRIRLAKGESTELFLIIKADVQGSLEAIIASLKKLENDEVTIKIIHSGVGGVNASDVTLASATGATVICFNTRANKEVKDTAEKEGVDVFYHSIIYDLIDDVKGFISGMMKPIMREKFLGNAQILQIFKMSKYGKVAGCMVKEGVIKRGSAMRLIRGNIVIHTGKLKTLKRFKDDVPEVKQGFECGAAFENYEDIKEGDFIEAFEIIEEKQKID